MKAVTKLAIEEPETFEDVSDSLWWLMGPDASGIENVPFMVNNLDDHRWALRLSGYGQQQVVKNWKEFGDNYGIVTGLIPDETDDRHKLYAAFDLAIQLVGETMDPNVLGDMIAHFSDAEVGGSYDMGSQNLDQLVSRLKLIPSGERVSPELDELISYMVRFPSSDNRKLKLIETEIDRINLYEFPLTRDTLNKLYSLEHQTPNLHGPTPGCGAFGCSCGTGKMIAMLPFPVQSEPMISALPTFSLIPGVRNGSWSRIQRQALVPFVGKLDL